MDEKGQFARLRIVCDKAVPVAGNARLYLDGVEITQHTRSVRIEMNVNGVNTAHLSLLVSELDFDGFTFPDVLIQTVKLEPFAGLKKWLRGVWGTLHLPSGLARVIGLLRASTVDVSTFADSYKQVRLGRLTEYRRKP